MTGPKKAEPFEIVVRGQVSAACPDRDRAVAIFVAIVKRLAPGTSAELRRGGRKLMSNFHAKTPANEPIGTSIEPDPEYLEHLRHLRHAANH